MSFDPVVARAEPPGRTRVEPRVPRAPRRPLPPSVWQEWDDDELLGLRLCDLGLRIAGTGLVPLIAQVRRELRERGILFRPHFWLSDDWFCPDSVPGAAVPFYLAHPRLARLEQSQMLEVEGGTPEWCLRILRHETGHGLENAYQLQRRRRRRELFGRTSLPYPKFFLPKPYSKSYVIHLESWYGQSHPDEDFAETFAVWLTPGSDWRRRYAGWKALQKLEYMDELMREVALRPVPVLPRRRIEALPALKKTLGSHYAAKRRHYRMDEPDLFDSDLRRLFSSAPEYARNPSAASFISRTRKDARRSVRRWTGEYQYIIDRVLGDMIARCRGLGLRLTASEEQTRQEFMILLTVQTMHYLHSGRHRLAL
jgi:hypothetical protein